MKYLLFLLLSICLLFSCTDDEFTDQSHSDVIASTSGDLALSPIQDQTVATSDCQDVAQRINFMIKDWIGGRDQDAIGFSAYQYENVVTKAVPVRMFTKKENNLPEVALKNSQEIIKQLLARRSVIKIKSAQFTFETCENPYVGAILELRYVSNYLPKE